MNYNISWMKASSTHQFSVHNHTLHIPAVQLNDSGKHYCIVISGDSWMAQDNASGILQVTGMRTCYCCVLFNFRDVCLQLDFLLSILNILK